MSSRTQEAFLRDFHARQPAVTSLSLGKGRSADGRSSYELLRDEVADRRRVLDLGCGDGLLLALLARTPGREVAGVDLSHEALVLARRRPELPRSPLVECRAQQLPFPAGGFDAAVSHMALMLMADVEQVLAELARVLRPGAVLACALGGGAAGGEAYALLMRLLRPLLDGAREQQRVPVLGDRRTRERESFDGLLRGAGFGPARWETVRVDLSGPLDEVWQTMSGIYDLGPLDPSQLAELRREFLAQAKALTPPGGHTPCAMDVRLARATLRPRTS